MANYMENGMNMAHFYFFFSSLIFHDLLVGDGDFPLSRPRLPRHDASARMRSGKNSYSPQAGAAMVEETLRSLDLT